MNSDAELEAAHEFEAAIHATDDAIRGAHKRVRESLIRSRRLLTRPKGEAFPFHLEVDTLEAVLQATTAVTGDTHPEFDLKSNPQRLFEWTRDAQIAYGNECREEGRQLEREQLNTTRLSPPLALELLDLVARANKILETPRT